MIIKLYKIKLVDKQVDLIIQQLITNSTTNFKSQNNQQQEFVLNKQNNINKNKESNKQLGYTIKRAINILKYIDQFINNLSSTSLLDQRVVNLFSIKNRLQKTLQNINLNKLAIHKSPIKSNHNQQVGNILFSKGKKPQQLMSRIKDKKNKNFLNSKNNVFVENDIHSSINKTQNHKNQQLQQQVVSKVSFNNLTNQLAQDKDRNIIQKQKKLPKTSKKQQWFNPIQKNLGPSIKKQTTNKKIQNINKSFQKYKIQNLNKSFQKLNKQTTYVQSVKSKNHLSAYSKSPIKSSLQNKITVIKEQTNVSNINTTNALKINTTKALKNNTTNTLKNNTKSNLDQTRNNMAVEESSAIKNLSNLIFTIKMTKNEYNQFMKIKQKNQSHFY